MGELQCIKGVGQILELKLATSGIRTLLDLLRFFPKKYEIHRIQSFFEATLHTEITLKATITKDASVSYIRRRLTKLSVETLVDEHLVKVSIFNREFLRKNLSKDVEIVITGKFETNFTQFSASDIVLKKNYQEGIIPVYNLPEIGDKTFSKIVTQAFQKTVGTIKDDIPAFLREKNGIAEIGHFYEIVHHPEKPEDILQSSRRIKYDELLKFALRISLAKQINDGVYAKPKTYDLPLVKQMISQLPFELTEDQKTATNDIFRDLKRPTQMMRLLQGDVGSGKTIVSAIAILAVVSGEEQVALMAPTEILAHQHFQTMKSLLSPYEVRVAFLSSAIKGEERAEILAGLRTGSIHLIVGTHSLIQEPIRFKSLGFAIIDEQHRFGVRQRKSLREKGLTPDMLFMSATPIPRTLAISLFGDMDVSSIKTMPIGRKPVQTEVVDFSHLDEVFRHVEKELEKGHQAYFIVPLISENEKADFSDVFTVSEELKKRFPPKFRVAGLHGKMSSEEKTKILNAFSKNEIAVLVSTTVVEVGVDVPNASEMVVLNCEHFGLSQLHQLRGRVGRSTFQAYCHFLTDAILSGSERFSILEKTHDGFLIAEEDLRQRGPGEVFGEEQTGIPKFRMANLVEDKDLLETAFADAKMVLKSTDSLSQALLKKTFLGIEDANLD